MAVELDPIAGPEGGEEGRRLASFWLDQIQAIDDSAEYKRWFKRGEDIEKRYRDERNRVSNEDGTRRYNSLWSNVEILKPALYGREPLPVAERRFHDKDPVGRGAATILERALRNEIEICGYDEAMQRVVSDYLLPGRGTVWVRYEPEIAEGVSLPPDPIDDLHDDEGDIDEDDATSYETMPSGRRRLLLAEQQGDPDGDDDAESTDETAEPEEDEEQEKLDSTGDRIIRESTPIDFIHWKDFRTLPARARTWKEVTTIGKRVYMSRGQMVKRFGRTIGKAIPLEKDNRGQREQQGIQQADDQDKGQIWELWCKDDRKIYWVSLGYPYLLDCKDDPLKLQSFWPVPRPLYANPTNNTLIPVPDYVQYQDQAIQIDELTQRISMLTKACKMAGVYNAAAKDIQRLFAESVENELIPVDDWTAFAEKGGIEGNWSLMPVDLVIKTITELQVCKQKQIEEMDRLTGINDIMRGTSDARETLGGVRLKVNSTGTRLTSRQNEVARFCRDIIRIMADIMCQHFSPKSLIEASGALYAEGLGPDDLPGMAQLMNPTAMQSPDPPPGAPPALPPPASAQGGPPMPPMPQPGLAPGAGQNTPIGAPGIHPPPMPPQTGGQPGLPAPMPPQMPQVPQPPQVPPQVMAKFQALQRILKSIGLLRDEKLRGFRVDLEVDSTIFPDQEQEKQDRTQFIQSVTQYMATSLQIGGQAPEMIPLLARLLQFGVRGWRVGRDLETSVDEFIEQSVGMAQHLIQQRNSQPNPAVMKQQTEHLRATSQAEAAKSKADSDKVRAQAEIDRQQVENQGEQANAQSELASNKLDLEMKLIDKRIEEMRMQMEMIKLRQAQAQPVVPPVAPAAPAHPASGTLQ